MFINLVLAIVLFVLGSVALFGTIRLERREIAKAISASLTIATAVAWAVAVALLVGPVMDGL